MNALIPKSVDDAARMARAMHESGYFPDVRSAQQAFVKMSVAMELGFTPFVGLMNIHIVEGKPELGSNLVASAIKNHPRYDYRVEELSADVCRLAFYEVVGDNRQLLGKEELTIKEANERGLTTYGANKPKDVWRKYPKNMLFARCITNGAKFHCPDTTGGIPVYSIGEIEQQPEPDNSEIDIETGEIMINGDEPAEVPVSKQDQLDRLFVNVNDRLPEDFRYRHINHMCNTLRKDHDGFLDWPDTIKKTDAEAWIVTLVKHQMDKLEQNGMPQLEEIGDDIDLDYHHAKL